MMGIKKQPSYRDYWSSNPQLNDPYISSFMPINRFFFILSHFHLNDNAKEPGRDAQNYDKLYKVRPFIDKLSENYKKFYSPTRKQSIDESMIKFKGRSSLKQYMPQKAIPRGYKVWVRADEHGFTCEFQIYTGKINGKSETSLGARVVKTLSSDLANQNYEIYFDNYFSSVDLMLSLKNKNINACGTIRRDRKFLPKRIRKDLTPGEYEFKTSYKGLTWVQWYDKKIVNFISNFHDPSILSIIQRKQKDGSYEYFSCPNVIEDYNANMGFVDKADRSIATYGINKRSKKWWHRIFWHFIDVSIVNSYILYKLTFPNRQMTLKDFRLSVVDGLLKCPDRRGRGRPKSEQKLPKNKLVISEEFRKSGASHMPAVLTTGYRRCHLCSTAEKETRTKFYCKKCDVPLCIREDGNCFEKHHM